VRCGLTVRDRLLAFVAYFVSSPFSAVEGEGFRAFSKGLNSAYEPCCAKTVKAYAKILFTEAVSVVCCVLC
jgi:hypothetical protein